MHIAFITTISYPSRMANRIHVISMCKALLRIGHSVDLYTKKTAHCPVEKTNNFRCFEFDIAPGIYSTFQKVKFIKKNKIEYDLFYIREPRLLLWFILWGKIFRLDTSPIVYEVHDIPRERLASFALRALEKLVSQFLVIAISSHLKKDLVEQFDVPNEKILVLPDGVNMSMFDQSLTKKEARTKLKFDDSLKYIVYTGHLYEWKGVYTLCEAARLSPDLQYIIVGGKDEDINHLRSYVKENDLINVKIIGYISHDKIPTYLYAADILVLPNSKTVTISEKYTSPLKLFEYMAAGRVIVASDLPSIRDILTDNENAILFTPDDPKDLNEKIKLVLFSKSNNDMVQRSLKQVLQYSWEKRAGKILANFP